MGYILPVFEKTLGPERYQHQVLSDSWNIIEALRSEHPRSAERALVHKIKDLAGKTSVVPFFALHDSLAEYKVKITHVNTKSNYADCLTKPMDVSQLLARLVRLKPETAPGVNTPGALIEFDEEPSDDEDPDVTLEDHGPPASPQINTTMPKPAHAQPTSDLPRDIPAPATKTPLSGKAPKPTATAEDSLPVTTSDEPPQQQPSTLAEQQEQQPLRRSQRLQTKQTVDYKNQLTRTTRTGAAAHGRRRRA